MPDALSTHKLIENVRTKCIIFGEALRIRVKQFRQNLPENYSQSTKVAITACNFSKNFRGSMPPGPLQLFLLLNQHQICSVEKIHVKKCENFDPPFKISRYASSPRIS